MNDSTSPHIFAELIAKDKHVEHRLENDLSFYKEQDHLEEIKNKSGLIGLKAPRRTFNIMKCMDVPRIVNENFQIATSFLIEDFTRISEQLASGESPDHEQMNLKKQREEIASMRQKLNSKLELFKSLDFDYVKNRSFLTLSLYSYEQYVKYIENAEDGLFLLNNHNQDSALYFYRELLNKDHYIKFEELYLSAKTPADLRVLFLSFINNPISNERLAISYYEDAISGYYLHVADGSPKHILQELSLSHPNILKHDSHLDCWVLKADSLTKTIPKILEMFDIWLDVGQATIYKKSNISFTYNMDIKPIISLDTSYTYGLLFDYVSPPPHITEDEVRHQISELGLSGSIQTISFLLNNSFQKANGGVLWSYAELLLIKFELANEIEELTFEDQTLEYLALYCTKQKKIIFFTHNIGFIADNCLILYNNTINLLNINSFEQVNPYLLLNS